MINRCRACNQYIGGLARYQPCHACGSKDIGIWHDGEMLTVEQQQAYETYANIGMLNVGGRPATERAEIDARFKAARERCVKLLGYDPLSMPLQASDFGF